MKVYLRTLGCAKNEFDSSVLEVALREAGCEVVARTDDADAAILNTCAFIEPAIEESLEALAGLRAALAPGVPLVVTGCLVNYLGAAAPDELPEADFVVPIARQGDIPGLLLGTGGAAPVAGPCPAFSRYRTAQDGRASAYLKVAEGCSNGCAYCAIPVIRGASRSLPPEAVAEEAARLARGGTREFVLVAQDLARYGADRGEADGLERLVEAIGRSVGRAVGGERFWIRLLYMNPDHLTPPRLARLFSLPHVVPYADVPVQSGSTGVLRRMGRRRSADEVYETIAALRVAVPHAVVRTAVMAGFPGESEDEFEETRAFIRALEPDYCAVFAYSRMPGTRAAELDGQVAPEVVRWRARELSAVADAIAWARAAEREGAIVEVLVEERAAVDEARPPCAGERVSAARGRFYGQAPDVDGVVWIGGEAVRELPVGTIANVRLERAEGLDYVGVLAADARKVAP